MIKSIKIIIKSIRYVFLNFPKETRKRFVKWYRRTLSYNKKCAFRRTKNLTWLKITMVVTHTIFDFVVVNYENGNLFAVVQLQHILYLAPLQEPQLIKPNEFAFQPSNLSVSSKIKCLVLFNFCLISRLTFPFAMFVLQLLIIFLSFFW